MTHKAVAGKSRAFHPDITQKIPTVAEAIAAHQAVVAELQAGNIVPVLAPIIADRSSGERPTQVVVLEYAFVHGTPSKDVHLS